LIQVQTYDVTDSFTQGNNTIEISLGDGWYKGNLGFDGGKDKIYGDQQRAILELHLLYADGTEDIVNTDDQWLTTLEKLPSLPFIMVKILTIQLFPIIGLKLASWTTLSIL
jgi:Alpha-L-rhamnosidase N-terminal domain.